jgi:signal peptidase II
MSTPTRATRCVALAIIVTCLVGCDQATKVYAVRNLKGQPPQSYLGDVLRIHYVENPGAFLGLMGGLHADVRFWALTVANAVILSWVAIYILLGKRVDRWVFFALALIVAGGVGNLIDRARLGGYVIDFLNLGFGQSTWQRTGIFNVADVAITAGFLMLLPFLFRGDASETRAPTAS